MSNFLIELIIKHMNLSALFSIEVEKLLKSSPNHILYVNPLCSVIKLVF